MGCKTTYKAPDKIAALTTGQLLSAFISIHPPRAGWDGTYFFGGLETA